MSSILAASCLGLFALLGLSYIALCLTRRDSLRRVDTWYERQPWWVIGLGAAFIYLASSWSMAVIWPLPTVWDIVWDIVWGFILVTLIAFNRYRSQHQNRQHHQLDHASQ